MNEKFLEIKGLNKSYPAGKTRTTVIRDMDLTISQGEFVCIIGPSGCGKSTLIRCIAGFEDYEGEIFCSGKKVTKPGTDRIMVFQDFNQLYPWKTVEQNIQYPLKVQGLKDKAELKRISDEFLRKVDLDGKQKCYPHELSGGMKQRVAIAKALALNPDLILMDEPFAALDAMTRNNLQDELQNIYNRENVTVLFITHNIQEAISLGTRVLFMGRDGQIKIDWTNTIPKPTSPATPGYGPVWEMFSSALKKEKAREEAAEELSQPEKQED